MTDIIITAFMTVAHAICVCSASAFAIVAIRFLIWAISYLVGWGVRSGWNEVADTTDDDDDETDEEDEAETTEDDGGVA